MSQETEMDKKQVDVLKKHLALVFKHEIDPSYGDDDHQNELNEIHHPGSYVGNDTIFRC